MKSKYLLLLLFFVFLFIFIGGSIVSAIECNADLSQGGNSCTISSSLILNGTYEVNLNSSGNVFGSGALVIGASNIEIDGNGTTIIGNYSGAGLTSFGYVNVTFINFSFYNFLRPIFVQNGDNLNISYIDIYNFTTTGIDYRGITNSTIYRCNVIKNNTAGTGIAIEKATGGSSDNNFILENYINGSENAISFFGYNSNNTISNNIIYDSVDAIKLVDNSTDNYFSGNIINYSNPYGYYTEEFAMCVRVLEDSVRNVFYNNSLNYCGWNGFDIETSYNNFTSNQINNPFHNGFDLYDTSSGLYENSNQSNYNTIDNNIITNLFGNVSEYPTGAIGILIISGGNNIITNNNITINYNVGFGIVSYGNHSININNLFEGNIISNTSDGIYIHAQNTLGINTFNDIDKNYKITNPTESLISHLMGNLTTNQTVYSITNDQYLFTATSSSRNQFNYTLAPNEEIQVQDYSCTVPYEDMTITEDTTFCSGTYYLNGSTSGAIKINSNDIVLDCNGADLIGNYTDGAGSWYAGIRINNNNVTVKNCKIHDYWINILSASYINQTKIINNTFNMGNRLVSVGGNNYEIINNTFSNQSVTSGFYSSNGKNGLIKGNVFNKQQTTGYQINTYSNTDNLTIQENIFRDSSQIQISITSDANGFPSNVSIINNVFANSTSQSIYLSNTTNSNISYNLFYNTTRVIYSLNDAGGTYSFNNVSSIKILSDQFLFNNYSNGVIDNNNVFGDSRLYQSTFGFLGSGSNLTIKNNFWTASQYGVSFYNNNYENINISNNTADFMDMGLGWIQGNNIYIEDNLITNSTITGLDGYFISGKCLNCNNTYIRRNNFSEMWNGFLIQKSSNLMIEDNFFYGIPRQSKPNYLATSGNNAECAILINELYVSWLGTGLEISSEDNITYISNYSSNNVSIKNNYFDDNIQCYLQTEGTTNLTHDLSNYWYRKIQTPIYLKDPMEFFINILFNNLTTTGVSSNSNVLYSTYYGGATEKMTYEIHKEYIKLNNINLTITYQTIVFNLTNFLAYNTNGSIYGSSNIQDNDGNINITLTPNNASYVLDNFICNETAQTANGYPCGRENSPINLIRSGNSISIESDLVDSINITIILNTEDYDNTANIEYNPGGGGSSQNYIRPGITQVGDSNDISVEFGSVDDGGTIVITYSFDNQELSPICRSLTRGFGTAGTFIIIIVLGLVAVFAIKAIQGEIDTNYLVAGLVALGLAVLSIVTSVILLSGLCS